MNFNTYLENYKKSHSVYMAGGIPWRKYKGILKPLTHPNIEPNFSNNENLKKILKESKALFAMWTYDFNTVESKWWWVIAENPYEANQLRNKSRYNIRHSLRNCEVKKISGKQLSEIGYNCYISSMIRHEQSSCLDEFSFKKGIERYDHNDAYEIWGVFYKKQIIGYGLFKIIDSIVYQGDTIFDPKYFKYHTSYAFIHITTDYYLNEKSYTYIIDGERSVNHVTRYQEFLIREFNRKKYYCKLGLEYSYKYNMVARFTYMFRMIWGNLSLPRNVKSRLETVYTLENIRRNAKN